MRNVVIIFGLIVVPVAIFYGAEQGLFTELFAKEGSVKCQINEQNTSMTNNDLSPIIKENDPITFLENYYCQYRPKKNDLAVYKSPISKTNCIRQIRVDSKDHLRFTNNQLYVNNELLHDPNNVPYTFSPFSIERIKEDMHNDQLFNDMYLIFGRHEDEENDSRAFGAVAKINFAGKIIKR